MNKLAHEELTGRIIACAIEVHKALEPGFPESIFYEAAMTVELERAGLKVEPQKPLRTFIVKFWLANTGLICSWKKKLSWS